MQRVLALVLMGLTGIVGCGGYSNPGKVADPVDVSGTVTFKGQPLNDVTLNLQPAGAGHPVVATVTDGKFKAHVTPGEYIYFFTEGSSPAILETLPKDYRSPNDLREPLVVDSSTSSLDLKVD